MKGMQQGFLMGTSWKLSLNQHIVQEEKRMKVVYFRTTTISFLSKYANLFAEKGIEYEEVLNAGSDPKLISDKSRGAEVLVTSVDRFPSETVELLDSSVKCILRTADGYDIIDLDACSRRGIMVCNVPDFNVEEVATHTAALILICNDYTLQYDRRVRAGEWQKMGWVAYPNVHRMSELTVGLLGFGKIGRPTARNLSGFGCRICAYDPYLTDEVFEKMGVERTNSLDELFASSDIISLHTPLFDSTYHIIDEEAIKKMKDGVVIVNTSRGELIDDVALVQALKNGKVKAAGLGVHTNEPINSPDNPYFSLDNVVLTPHTASYSLDAREQLGREAVELAIDAAYGRMPFSCVNRKALVAAGEERNK